MIDARRMEVYTATFTPEGRMTSQIEAKIIDASSFSKELSDGPVLFIGDGAQKCASLFESNPNAHFINCCTKAFLLLPIIGIILVIEAGSSLLQMFSKKVFKRKIFLSAPVHHHLMA